MADNYWEQSSAVTGTDSRTGILIHEISHYPFMSVGSVIRGTDDFEELDPPNYFGIYGIKPSQALRDRDQKNVLNHADSFQFFIMGTYDEK